MHAQAPVTQLVWQLKRESFSNSPTTTADTANGNIQEASGEVGEAALLSLCGSGKILRWEIPLGYISKYPALTLSSIYRVCLYLPEVPVQAQQSQVVIFRVSFVNLYIE